MVDQVQSNDEREMIPSAIMRSRRPYLFSDSITGSEPIIPRHQFEYHLDTLTSRKQEYEFEHFCRKLAEKEICPNLHIQTGPTGGGDGKVDAETYPVDPAIATRWYTGAPEAAGERWAFAFSAKKDWKSKLNSDLKSILSTDRNYTKIFFFTNQFASDRERTSREDKFFKDEKIRLTIISRVWLVEKVFANDHLGMAIEALGIAGASAGGKRQIGPFDASREIDLNDLDKQIADQSRYEGVPYQLVEDCLESAVLARGLERSRDEIEGRFVRAKRLSDQHLHFQQRLRIEYAHAWTAHWWFDDFRLFAQLFDGVEQRAAMSDVSDDIELWVNLFNLWTTAVHCQYLTASNEEVEHRSSHLLQRLTSIAEDRSRPNNALSAQALKLLVQLSRAIAKEDEDTIESAWKSFLAILKEAENAQTFDLESFGNTIVELGNYFDSDSYEQLHGALVEALRQRNSEGTAGVALSTRASQMMQKGKFYRAIVLFGKAEQLLSKKEHRGRLTLSLIGSSIAYTEVGLLWAAHNKAVAALEVAFSAYRFDGQIIPALFRAAQHLFWIEVRLGRIPYILKIFSLEVIAAAALSKTPEARLEYKAQIEHQELATGVLFLKTPTESLSRVRSLPPLFDELGLFKISFSILLALGNYEAARNEGYCPKTEIDDDLKKMRSAWRDQPITDELARSPTLLGSERYTMESTILGAKISLICDSKFVCVCLAESVLGALEAFVSTFQDTDIIPNKSVFKFKVCLNEKASAPTLKPWSLYDDYDVEIETPSAITGYGDEKTILPLWLKQVILNITLTIFHIRDPESWAKQVLGEENALSRALNWNDMSTLSGNVFGDDFDYKRALVPKGDQRVYDIVLPISSDEIRKTSSSDQSYNAADVDRSDVKHTDRTIVSPIDINLWNAASWTAVGYAYAPNIRQPMLILIFKSRKAALQIFWKWKKEWNGKACDQQLRVALIKDLDTKLPLDYTITIGGHFSEALKPGQFVLSVARLCRMQPQTANNLFHFLAIRDAVGSFLLVPGYLTDDGGFDYEIELAFFRRQLLIRSAWEIGQNDVDLSVIDLDDNPIIPAGISNAPVFEARALRARMNRN